MQVHLLIFYTQSFLGVPCELPKADLINSLQLLELGDNRDLKYVSLRSKTLNEVGVCFTTRYKGMSQIHLFLGQNLILNG